MTPDERLDQLEPLLADGLQKIDRLIEGQGKLTDLAVETEHRVSKIERQVSITAEGVGKLTLKVNNLADNQETLADNQETLADNQTALADKQTTLADNQTALADNQTALADNQVRMEQEVKEGFTEMKQRFDVLQKFLEERLK